MRVVDARKVLSADKRGSGWPVLVQTDEGVLFTKLRGAGQGTGALVAEIIVAELAQSLGMNVPGRCLVRFADVVESVDQNDELADLLQASAGINLGFVYLDGAENFSAASDLERVSPEAAAAILWLDGLVMNPDRTARNTNLLWWRDELWLIDHGAALSFQYALPDVDLTAAARRPYALREPHLLHDLVGDPTPWDASLAPRLSPAAVSQAVDAVPDEFLTPLIRPDGATPSLLAEWRRAYVEYLTRRLEPPRPFLEIVDAPSGQQRRGRPSWLHGRKA